MDLSTGDNVKTVYLGEYMRNSPDGNNNSYKIYLYIIQSNIKF